MRIKKISSYIPKNKIGIVLLGLLMILGIAFCIWKYGQPQNGKMEQGTVRFEANYKSNIPGNLVFPAYTRDLVIENNTKEIPIILVNPKVNKNFYFKYELSLLDKKTGKETKSLGETKLIKAGYAANKFSVLSKDINKLKNNTQKCRINVLAYTNKKNKQIKINQAHWDINLIIR